MSDLHNFVEIGDTAFGIGAPNSIKIIGTKVVTGSSDYRALFTTSEILSMLKEVNPNINSFSSYQCVVSTNNGDASAANVHFYEPEYWTANNAYYQYFYPSISGPIRINYQIEYVFA